MRRVMYAIYRLLCYLNDILAVFEEKAGRRYKNRVLGKTVRRLFR